MKPYLHYTVGAVLCIALSLGAYRIGYNSVADDRVVNQMPTVTFDIMSSRNSGHDLAVRRVPDGKTGYVEGSCLSHCPQFDVGERVTMERWTSTYGTKLFVYHWQRGDDDTSYYEHTEWGEGDKL